MTARPAVTSRPGFARRAGAIVTAVASAALAVLAIGCRGSSPDLQGHVIATDGDAARGRRVIVQANCGACHVIPGVPSARGVVAAPLTSFARRSYIAGEVANTPDNLVQWIRDPQRIEPGTAMPAVGLDEQQARDVAAYLYLLR